LEINRAPLLIAPAVDLIDVPGHPKLQALFLDRLLLSSDDSLKNSLRGILVMVNSMSTVFLSQYRALADSLYSVLCSARVRRNQVPVLIACHFQDGAPMAFGKDRIRSMLELEMDKVRTSRVASQATGMAKGDGGDTGAIRGVNDDDIYLGVDGKPFAFDDLETSMQFVETQVADLGAIEEWLQQL
jgi:hypothetical protein